MAKIQKFDPTLETWQRFVDRVNLSFTADEIPDDAAHRPRRKAKLLLLMGVELYNKLRDVVGDGFDQLTFDQIVDRVQQLVNPAPLEISERFRFLTRRQEPTETAAEYMVALRKMALPCHFDNDAQNPMNARLRDQFVCGLAKKEMQQYLLQQPALTVDNVVTLATTFDSAEKGVELISKPSSSNFGVNKVNSSRPPGHGKSKTKMIPRSTKSPAPGKCKHCGLVHPQCPEDRCRFRNHTCFNCQRLGHLAGICPRVK